MQTRVLDGMDVSICIINKEKNKIQFAGANNPLYLIRNNELVQIKADKFSVGLSITGEIHQFSNNIVNVQKGDTLYMFSDGYADQLGGEDANSKFFYKRFRDFLIKIHQKDMYQQAKDLELEFNIWRGNLDQIDDILIFGFRI